MISITAHKNSAINVLEELLIIVNAELQLIEAELEKSTLSSFPAIEKLSIHTLKAGGKRLRPALIALCYKTVNPEQSYVRLIKCGAAIELMHTATLIHDDVIDESDLRRGKPTANKLWGSTASVLSGDVLFAKAMRMMAEDGDIALIRLLSQMVLEMCEGAAQEAHCRGRLDISENEYFEIIRKKTALFIKGCCKVGAILGGGTDEQINRLSKFGYHAGMAFQIADDLLDYVGDPNQTGKAVGTDYREGACTLPLISAQRLVDSNQIQSLTKHFNNGATDEWIGTVANIVNSSGAEEYSRKLALEHLALAHEQLSYLPETEAKRSLIQLAHFIVQRSV